MIDATGSAITAMKAFQKKMNVTAHNVANVNTDEYKKSRVTLSEGRNGGVQATPDQVDTPGFPKETVRNGEIVETTSSNVDLAEELPEMMIAEGAYKANAKTVQSQDRLLGFLLNMFS
jgi:flagellar basal-body rod protein FlgC